MVQSQTDIVCAIVVLHVVQLVGFAVFPYATCTHQTPTSVGQIVFNVTFVVFVADALLFIVKLPPVGAMVSRIIVSEICVLILPKLSLNCIYTVLFPSWADIICAIVALHVVQLVGFVVVQNATSTHPTHPSVAQMVFNVTFVPLVAVALLFIVNRPHAGAVLSCVLFVLALQFVVLPKLSLALTK